MKKTLGFLIAALIFTGSLSAQINQRSSEGSSGNVSGSVYQVFGNTLTTSHYELFAEAGAETSLQPLARELELRFDVYNKLFRFDPATLQSPLRVRIFSEPPAYESYVRGKLGTSRAGAVYLHYNNSENREDNQS